MKKPTDNAISLFFFDDIGPNYAQILPLSPHPGGDTGQF